MAFLDFTVGGNYSTDYVVPASHIDYGGWKYNGAYNDRIWPVGDFSQLVDAAAISSPVTVSADIFWTNTSTPSEVGLCCINSSRTGWSVIFTGTGLTVRKEVAGSPSTTLTTATSGLPNAEGTHKISATWNNTTGVINILVDDVVKATTSYTDNLTGLHAGAQIYKGDGSAQQLYNLNTAYSAGSNSIDTITSPILLGGSGSITTTGLGTLTSLTIGGKAVSSLSAPSGDGTFSIPAWTDGAQGFALGAGQTTIAGDGTNTASGVATINPQTGYTLVTLTSVSTTIGYLGNQVSMSVGDQIIFPTAASLGATTNYIDVDGGIYTDFTGTQTIYKRNSTTGIVTQITLINGQVAPSKFALLWFFGV